MNQVIFEKLTIRHESEVLEKKNDQKPSKEKSHYYMKERLMTFYAEMNKNFIRAHL